jgi:hypothetical protein
MKNLIIFSILATMAVVNFSGCGKAQERPAKVSTKISGEVVELNDLADITVAERQDSPENVAFKKQLISKIENAEQREIAESLLAQNRLVYMFMEGKVVLLEHIPSSSNKHAAPVSTDAATEATSETVAVAQQEQPVVKVQVIQTRKLHTYESLMAMKEGRNTEEVEALKVSNWSQNHFAVLAEIGIQTGILENERTDYNEKKSTLGLTETPLAQAQVVILKSEIKAETVASTNDASGAE